MHIRRLPHLDTSVHPRIHQNDDYSDTSEEDLTEKTGGWKRKANEE
jgi:hypothetical protein